MALLELKDIGKIYVSDNTVAVGIRGVNLSFDRGEFVAITGQSGSGKSTLLNVISGMDSYEEGELFIEGEQTSHYTQADWEKYREKYISFIFQEYNIIDSFTVLENVELSLMHITNVMERRQRAMELIRRVGLEDHIRHKGSHLSGGQKQRTVIARALAKDSPIILADEPTGNLDSETSKEIIALLREVSKDKLLIVVTHNFEEVEEYATREIRVYDHAVASDREMAPHEVPEQAEGETTAELPHKTARNSLKLGFTIFKAKPRLSLFICSLILVAGAILFLTFGSFWETVKPMIIDQHHMFNHLDGRVVIVKNDGTVMTDEELQAAAEQTGAKDYVRYDKSMDRSVSSNDWNTFCSYYEESIRYGDKIPLSARYDLDSVTPDVGRLPENVGETMVSVPYYMRNVFGTDAVDLPYIGLGYEYGDTLKLQIVGIHYYFDREVQGSFYMTKEGLEDLSKSMIKQTGSVKYYRQASLFYGSDSEARSKIDTLQELGFLASMSNETYKVGSELEVIEYVLIGVVYLVMWIFILMFLNFFIRICTQKSMDAFKPDIAIMRSMGIRVREIKAAIYIRMFLSMIPTMIILPTAATFLYRTTWGGKNLAYVKTPQYIIIFLILIYVVNSVARRHVKHLFSENVRSALKGGE
ncbi:MAG: ABC transporter ATP-binding protein [Lachnospiraceae bacterium]|nr:ABC transporter ATP-binding protein [Lachnospiraceae bacterium]